MKKFSELIDEIKPAADYRARAANNSWVGIIIHHTGLGKDIPADETAWEKFSNAMAHWLSLKDNTFVSAHFTIQRDGDIIQHLDPDIHVAFHAGASSYFHPKYRSLKSGWNEYAIGIELVGDGNRVDYSDIQYKECAALVRQLLEKYASIDPRCITGHENVSPGRKQDPGSRFNWRKFFKLIYLGG